MGRHDNRRTLKTRQRRRQQKLKARLKRKMSPLRLTQQQRASAKG